MASDSVIASGLCSRERDQLAGISLGRIAGLRRPDVGARRLFAIAGRSSDLLPTRTLFRYNPASNRWRVRRSMPESLSGVAAAAERLAGVETIFVFGGTNGSGVAEGSTYAYDVDTHRWSTKASMLANTFGSVGAVLGRDGRIYAAGLDWQGPARRRV